MTNRSPQTIGVHTDTDVGLRNFMLGTYRYMAMAMAVTATVAYFFGQYLTQNPEMIRMIFSPVFAIISFVVIVFGFGAVGRKLPSMSQGGVVAFLFGFAAFMGVLMSGVAIVYSSVIIAKIFFMTVAMFAALSFFGHTTERNLSVYIKYAVAAFLGYIAINFIGMFFPAFRPTGAMDMIIQAIALVAIAFITAWETQMLKRTYYAIAGNPAMEGKMSAYGAASLLLAFINMFHILLNLFGSE